MPLERDLVGDVAALHGGQQQRQCLRANESRCDELMRRSDLDVLGDDMQQRWRIDHVASQFPTIQPRNAAIVHSSGAPERRDDDVSRGALVRHTRVPG